MCEEGRRRCEEVEAQRNMPWCMPRRAPPVPSRRPLPDPFHAPSPFYAPPAPHLVDVDRPQV